MFKSLFLKYITAFMLIIVVSFMLLIIIIGNIINGYSEQVKTELITNSAAAAYTYVDGNYQKDIPFSGYIAQNEHQLAEILQALTVNADGITILIADAHGTLLMGRGVEQDLFPVGSVLPFADMSRVLAGESVQGIDTFGGALDMAHVVHAYPLAHEGEVYGALLICADSSDWMDLRDSTVQVIMAASLWVMINMKKFVLLRYILVAVGFSAIVVALAFLVGAGSDNNSFLWVLMSVVSILVVCVATGIIMWRISKLEDTIKNLKNQKDKDNE